MGNYTQFGGTIKLKPEHIETFKKLMTYGDNASETRPWNCWQLILFDEPRYVEFLKASDSHMIPFGSGQAGDPCYQELNDNGVFTFACSLKNRGNPINLFMEIIIPIVAESAELFDHYCECSTPNEYVFENGILTQTEESIYER